MKHELILESGLSLRITSFENNPKRRRLIVRYILAEDERGIVFNGKGYRNVARFNKNTTEKDVLIQLKSVLNLSGNIRERESDA
jgi:hypothetical protein